MRLRKKRPGKLMIILLHENVEEKAGETIILLHENARPHMANLTNPTMATMGW
jgi:hypothetical protein